MIAFLSRSAPHPDPLPRGGEGGSHVLVVDDDAGVRFTLKGLLEDEGLEVVEAADGEQALAQIEKGGISLVVSDVRMPKLDGLGLLERVQALPEPRPPVILVTAHGNERLAVEAIKRGAYDYFKKPFELDDVLNVVRRALGSVRLTRENSRLQSDATLLRSLVFVSSAMSRLAELVTRVAPRDVTVLITGESGTGKEKIAEALVAASTRAHKPFVRFNSAASPKSSPRPSCSDIRAAPSPGPCERGWACSAKPKAAPCCSMKSQSSGSRCRRDCCACCRKVKCARSVKIVR